MTDEDALREMISMKQILLRSLKKHRGTSDAYFAFWVLCELAVESGIALYGKEECLEKISTTVNYIVQRDNAKA